MERLKKECCTYNCPGCGGRVQRSWQHPVIFKWKCQDCGSEFGINTNKPTFLLGWRTLKPLEVNIIAAAKEGTEHDF